MCYYLAELLILQQFSQENLPSTHCTNTCHNCATNTTNLAWHTKFWHPQTIVFSCNVLVHSYIACTFLYGRPMPALHSQRVYTQLAIAFVPQNTEQAKVNWGIWSKFFKTNNFKNKKCSILIGCWARGFVLKNAPGQPARRAIVFKLTAHHWIVPIFTNWTYFGGGQILHFR